MKRITKLFMTLALLIIGVGEVNAGAQKNWTPSTAYGANWDGATNTASWSKNENGWYILYTGFTPATQNNSTEVDLSLFTKFHATITTLTGTASDAEGAYIELKIKSKNKEDKTIKLRKGANDIIFADYADAIDFSKILEITLWGTLAVDATEGSAVITELYIYSDRYAYQKQTVKAYEVGTALSLASVVSGNTLVSLTSGNEIAHIADGGNQIKCNTIDEAMSAVNEKGPNGATYQFRITKATDAGLVLPNGIKELYKIQCFNGDGSAVFRGPYNQDGYLNDIGWCVSINSGDNGDGAGCFWAMVPVEGQNNVYTISAYKKDGTKVRDLHGKTAWVLNVLKETVKEVDVLVEIQVEDTEDPGIPEVEKGWVSLITNGDLKEDVVTSFRTKNEDGGEIAAVIDATGGRKNGRGIKVVSKDAAGTDWGTQFFVKSSERLKEGQKFHIEFDYRADRPAEAATQAHRNPGDYNCNIGTINFTVNWKHFSETYEVTSDMCKQDNNEGDFYMLSFGMNLSHDRNTNNFYFDNIVFWTEDDPLKPQKIALQNAITAGKAQNPFAKTEDSFGALTTAINKAEGVLKNATAAVELENAVKTISDAIKGLQLVEGYSNLTAAMFKHYASIGNPGEGSSVDCAYELGIASGMPYGDSNVSELNWADLSGYGKLIVVTNGNIKPRFCMNRLEKDGQQAATQEASKMLDINDNNGNSWSADKYQTIDGNIFTIDLAAIVADYGFARLHSIKKQGWGAGVFVTDLLLTEATTVPVKVGSTGYATFSSTKAVDFTNSTIKAYTAIVSGKDITFTRIKQVPANTGVLLWGDANATDNLPILASGPLGVIQDNLVATATDMDGQALAGKYILAEKDGVVGFYKAGSSASLAAGKAYLVVPAGARIILPDGEVTGITAVEAAEAEAPVYNLQGQRVVKAVKGVNIKDGKKFIVR